MRYRINNGDSINDILKKVNDNDEIYISNGIYKEKIEILKNNITIVGESKENVIITNHDFSNKIMEDNNECNTFRTYTMLIYGNNVKISNLTIENSSIPSNKYGQAVALHVLGNDFLADNIILRSAQDTLFTGPLPYDLTIRYKGFLKDYQLEYKKSHQVYKNSTIIGDVDFIFGSAQALFYNCQIVSISNGYVAAPSHASDDKYGYLFYKCDLIKGNDNVFNVFLARPWRDYGTSAFIDCNIDNHINLLGFNKWNNTQRDKTARFYEYNKNINLSKREPWVNILNDKEKDEYIKGFLKEINYEL